MPGVGSRGRRIPGRRRRRGRVGGAGDQADGLDRMGKKRLFKGGRPSTWGGFPDANFFSAVTTIIIRGGGKRRAGGRVSSGRRRSTRAAK